MTRRRTHPRTPAPASARLGLPGLTAIVVLMAILAAATSGGALGLEVFLVGTGLCLIAAGVWRQRVGLVLGGATALTMATLATASTTPIRWESTRPLPLTVHVVDADTGSPIGDAALAVVGHEEQDVADRGRTGDAGEGVLIVPIQVKLEGALYNLFRHPRVELDDLGWEVEVAAEGYESAREPLAGYPVDGAPLGEARLRDLTIALRRRSRTR
ncbi:MAG TPA: hypothetical protein VMV69_20170 [Pirellulales bacterium]|nr:hypothetical protein [Pirellulales bacterium]